MRVVHCKREKYTVYIGRPSIFGNPFVIGKDGDRENVIRLFKLHVYENEEIMRAIRALKDSDVLGCWCKPAHCHGDVIVEIWQLGRK